MVRLSRPRPIGAADSYSDFQCGEASLDRWIKVRALRNETGGASRTFVSLDLDADRVAGYYCLSASALKSEDAGAALRRNMPDPIPVVLIGRLAVDQQYQSVGLGASLLQDAALRSLEASRLIGAKAILVHALSDDAQRFYEHFGFVSVPGSVRTLYLLIADAERTLEELVP